MNIVHATDYDAMSRKAAALFYVQLTQKPASVLGLATGSTPLGLYGQLAAWHQQNELDFSMARSVNLDEYAGLGAEHDQSYRYFMQANLFCKVNIKAENTHLPNGLAKDAAAECARYDALIEQLGGIDLQLLGIGHNGHIGFNEPADAFIAPTHKVALTESTIKANTRFFENEAQVPRFAYTMGMGPIMRARAVVVVVSGADKAAIVKQAFTGPITPACPASLLQLHPCCTLVGDAAALASL